MRVTRGLFLLLLALACLSCEAPQPELGAGIDQALACRELNTQRGTIQACCDQGTGTMFYTFADDLVVERNACAFKVGE